MSSLKQNASTSLIWIVVAVAVVVACFGWGLAASFYAHDIHRFDADPLAAGERSLSILAIPQGVATFLYVSITQLPNLFSVIAYVFKSHIWLPITVLVVEGLVIGGRDGSG